MKLKNLIWGFIIIGIVGTLGHFLYKWTGENTLVGYFFPVNESTWEHLKLLFFPTALFTLIEYFIIKDKDGYVPAAALSLIVGLISIVALFYTYSGVLGFKIEWFNIAIYYIALIIMLVLKNLFLQSNIVNGRFATLVSLVWFFAMAIMFVIFTYNPLDLGIFKEP